MEFAYLSKKVLASLSLSKALSGSSASTSSPDGLRLCFLRSGYGTATQQYNFTVKYIYDSWWGIKGTIAEVSDTDSLPPPPWHGQYSLKSCMVTYTTRVRIDRVRLPTLLVVSWTGKMTFPLSLFEPENLASRDGFGSPVPRQPAHLYTQSESGAHLWDSFRFLRRRPSIYLKPPYAIGAVSSLSGHAIVYRWRSLPRVRQHRASKPQDSSERVLPWQVTMDQLICTSLSHPLLVWSGHVESTDVFKTVVTMAKKVPHPLSTQLVTCLPPSAQTACEVRL